MLVLIGAFLFFILFQLSLLITALFDTVKGLEVVLQFNNRSMILNILLFKRPKRKIITLIFLRGLLEGVLSI